MYDTLYSLAAKLFIYTTVGRIFGEYFGLSHTDMLSAKGIIITLVGIGTTVFAIEYPLYLKRRNK